MGAAGRDFHNFNSVYRDDPRFEVVAFSATQIPGISGRRYPAELAGASYPGGIPIVDEADLMDVCRRESVQEADVILWDGGNNDFSFVKPDLSIAVVDALRPGQVNTHHPGETVVRMADVVVVNKTDSASSLDVQARYCYAETARPGLAGVIEEFITRSQAQPVVPS